MECWYIRYRGETLGIDNRCSWYRRADALNAFLASDQWLDYKDELIQQIRKESGDPGREGSPGGQQGPPQDAQRWNPSDKQLY